MEPVLQFNLSVAVAHTVFHFGRKKKMINKLCSSCFYHSVLPMHMEINSCNTTIQFTGRIFIGKKVAVNH
ncbi:hypothetical protein OPV22_028203 [Ensete ventricosum]|uniref:Uncharacterized protein n=1 Tax=Ensete ventricosum TaxID=4639 RepID=A0AAV8Q7W2_ENSVE|nr:hypothetical protein OPV22_028203 [Ensete ventricosum]